MPDVFVQATIPSRTNIPRDAVVNTFHFTGLGERSEFPAEIIGRLDAFYTGTVAGTGDSISQYMSTELLFTGARAKFYDMDDPEPRAPFADESLGLTQGSPITAMNLPGEVALCTSYRGDLQSGQNPARRRGRLYIGPLNTGALATVSNQPTRPAADFIATVADATERLASESTLGIRWVVHSRVAGTNTAIQYGWVDNAFDTMRKRGVDPTSRSNWSVEIP